MGQVGGEPVTFGLNPLWQTEHRRSGSECARLQAAAPNVHPTVDDNHRPGVEDILGNRDSST
jgi:hypothetical protein